MASKQKGGTRRTYSSKLKFQAVLEVLTGAKSLGGASLRGARTRWAYGARLC